MSLFSFLTDKNGHSFKDLVRINEELNNENLALQKQGLSQAQEMALEIQALMDEVQNLKQQLDQQAETANSKINETESESELLLLQLHQVQEELETVFLKEQETQKALQAKITEQAVLTKEHTVKLETINKEKASLIAERDQQTQIANERQAQLDELNRVLETEVKGSTEENELLLLQLHQVQEELETVFLKEQATQKALQEKTAQQETLNLKLEAIAKEKANLIAERDQQVKLANERQAKLDQLNSQLATQAKDHESKTNGLEKQKLDLTAARDEQTRLANERQIKLDTLHRQVETQVKDAQEENELLLLQLHQVQEELEHYFLEHQKLQRDNETYISRWQRLEDRLPNYLDYLSIVPISVDTVSDIPRVEWRATDITIGGVLVPEFNFATFLDDGNPGIELLGATNDQGQLLPVRLTPRGLVKPDAVEDIIQFRTMTTLHWRQINIAVNVIQHFFKDPQKAAAGHTMPDYFDLVFWRQAAMPLVADIPSLPPVFRFNNVKLKRELINPDYEHLWLVFHDAVYGNYHWPKLELRLGAANIQPGGFSRYPKLEIPRIDGKLAPFDSWFEEAFDDFGGKLELRFDLNRQIFDINVWLQLSSTDQAMMLSLIGALNIALKSMEQDKVAISRSWDSWRGLASGIVDVMRRTMAASNAPKPSADIETDQPEPLESAIEQPVPTQKPIQPQRRAKKNRRKR
jgi:chemotaxis protein histidine kinase CheA